MFGIKRQTKIGIRTQLSTRESGAPVGRWAEYCPLLVVCLCCVWISSVSLNETH